MNLKESKQQFGRYWKLGVHKGLPDRRLHQHQEDKFMKLKNFKFVNQKDQFRIASSLVSKILVTFVLTFVLTVTISNFL